MSQQNQNFGEVVNKNRCKLFEEKFKLLDLYGLPIHITYQGQKNYKSIPGSLISLMVLSLCLIYAYQKSIVLINREQPFVTTPNL